MGLYWKNLLNNFSSEYMITIICGEDFVSSRNYYNQQRINITPNQSALSFNKLIDFFEHWENNAAANLFQQKSIYFLENINKQINLKINHKQVKKLEEIHLNKEISVFIWEENVPSREIKLKKCALIKEFKPNQTIFKLINACYPGNKLGFLSTLNSLKTSLDEYFIFIMLIRHLRKLILAKEKIYGERLAPWQKSQLDSQASKWSKNSLIKYYDSFFRIDLTTKTGTNPLGIIKSINISACVFI